MQFPILTSIRHKFKKKSFNVGNVNLRLIRRHNFIFNNSFDEKKIKYNKKYNNDQSKSKVFINHLLDVKRFIEKKFDKNTSICEIGCGKGYFLKLLQENYKNIIGYDTSYEGNKKNVFKKYLSSKDKISSDLIILRQTLEHIPKHFQFLKMLKKISLGDPYILIEVPDLDWIKKKQAFWDITYEHVNYFTKKTFQNLFSKPIEIKNFFNGQYLLVLAKLSSLNLNYNKKIGQEKIKIDKIFPNINKRIDQIEKASSGDIYLWGGSTKTLMFLCHCKNKKKLLEKVKYVIDIDPKKQNMYLQIVNIKVISPKFLCKNLNNKDLVVVSNSIYLKEVKSFLDKNITHKVKCISLD